MPSPLTSLPKTRRTRGISTLTEWAVSLLLRYKLSMGGFAAQRSCCLVALSGEWQLIRPRKYRHCGFPKRAIQVHILTTFNFCLPKNKS